MAETMTIELEPHFDLKLDGEKAIISMRPTCMTLTQFPNREALAGLLKSKGVIFGVDLSALGQMLDSRSFNVETAVAAARAPIPGKDAIIETKVSPEGKAKPRIQSDGTADYKEIDSIVQVKQNMVLAIKTPFTEGEAGTDIFGRPIAAQPGRDANLPSGLNTHILEDKVTLIATKAGYLFRQSGLICIGETLALKGDVDFKSGNIHFEGDVQIQGSVVEGFTVEAAGNVEIGGEIDGAIVISQNGSVKIKGGVFGKSKCRLQAKQEVRVVFCQQSALKCGKVFVEKSLQDCDLETYAIEATAPECQVSGGKILCYGPAAFFHVGSENSRTEILILDEQEEIYRRDLAKLEKSEIQVQAGIEVYDKKLRSIKAIIAKAGNSRIPPKVAEDIKASGAAFQTLTRELAKVRAEKAMIETELAKPRDRSFSLKIKGDIKGAVHLNMFHIRKLLEPADSRKEFAVTSADGLVAYSIMK